ncbi:MAG: ATP-dependent protease, partial [Acidobacteriota bacterium]
MKETRAFEELPPEKLRWTMNPEAIPFLTTDDCKPCDEIIGQERALRAIKTGLEIKSLGYNIFITGMIGTGRTTTIKQLLERLKTEEKTPDDILY